MEAFRTFDQMEVKLVGATARPFETSVASARTCYSSRGVIYPEEVSADEANIALRDKIAASTLEAGHLTTRQHAHFTFAITGISRQCIWSFLHSHPYYNSEQVSQRYVRVKRGAYIMPPLPSHLQSVFGRAVDRQMETYEKLIHILKKPLSEDFFDRFKARKNSPQKWEKAIEKRAYEVARYVLGVGSTAYLYHTVSALTLLRYAKLCEHFETPEEQKVLLQKLLECVRKWDPLFEKELQDPFPVEQTVEYQVRSQLAAHPLCDAESFIHQFDMELEGKRSKLISYTENAPDLLARATGILTGQREAAVETLERILDPKLNPNLADTLNVTTLDPLSQLLHHVHFTFQKKLSHTADSQDQRHRTVLGSRPLLRSHYCGKPDYIVPSVISASDEAQDLYRNVMRSTFDSINILLNESVPSEFAFYLLPNAFPIRFVSTGDLHSLQHKWKLRTCYNAQEEIFNASIEEIRQVQDRFPVLARHLRAPCYMRMRAGTKPYCPEGDRFCGLPVWKYDISEYRRKSL